MHRQRRKSGVRTDKLTPNARSGPVAGTMDQVRPQRRKQLMQRLRILRLAGRSSSDPIRWQLCADPGQKQDIGDRIVLEKGLTQGGPLQKRRLDQGLARVGKEVFGGWIP